MQRLETMQDEVHRLMQICARLTQEVEEVIDWLKKILANTKGLLKWRSFQGELSVPESVSDDDASAVMSEEPESSEAPGQFTRGVSA